MPQRLVGDYYLTSRHHLLLGGIAKEGSGATRSMRLVYMKVKRCQATVHLAAHVERLSHMQRQSFRFAFDVLYIDQALLTSSNLFNGMSHRSQDKANPSAPAALKASRSFRI